LIAHLWIFHTYLKESNKIPSQHAQLV
jgi:hypothetical protein